MLTPSTVMRTAEPDFRALFDAVPVPCLALTREFAIVAVNDAYERLTGMKRGHLLGQNVFVAFPDNPGDPHATGTVNLRASLIHVLETRSPHTMAPQRYDIVVSDASGTRFEERYWSPVNIPIFNSEGKLTHILNRSEEITALVKSQIRTTEMESQISAQALVIAHQEQFASLFEQAPIFMAMLTGPEHRIDFANAGYMQLIGHRDILSQTVMEALPEAAAQGYIALLDEVYRSGNPYSAFGAKYAMQALPAGPVDERYVDFVYQPIRTPKGVIQGILVQGIDVTERVLADARRNALIRLTDELRDLGTLSDITSMACKILGETLDVSRVGYGTIDPDAETLFIDQDWNAPGIQTVAGEHKFRDYGSFIDDLKIGKITAIDDVGQDDRTSVAAEAFKNLSAVSLVHVPVLEHSRLVAILFVNNAHVRTWSDDDLAFIKEVAERTRTATERLRNEIALRESEAKFRTIADAMPQMVWSTLPDGFHDYYNEQWYEFTGAEVGSTDGEAWNSMFHPEDQARAWDVWRHSLATGETYEIHYRLRHRSGQYRWVLGRALPIRDRSGNITRWMGTCTDFHNQKLTEEKLKEVDRRKDEFLAMLAHELRNPLAPIGAAAELLQLTRLDEQRLKQTSLVIGRQVNHMTGLIDDLLDVSRVTRGLVALNNAPLDIRHIAADAVEQVTPLIHSRRHHFALHLPPETTMVMGDKKRLVQVMVNILNNAAKYTQEGGNIALKVDVQAEHIVIEVEDNGIGMVPELVAGAFDLFTQAERTSDRSSGGLGLGLALVKSLTELHGGRVTCESAGLGKGSRFTVCLPRLIQESNQASQQSVDIHLPQNANSLRIMVVDDNVDAASMLAMLLEALGHQIIIEHTARKALERAKKETPHICLLDIGLPDMDGTKLAQLLRAQPQTAHALLIAVTGYGQEQDRERTLAAGFDHHLVKPVDTKELAAILAQVSSE
jgi:PAS domain S-box-containing protein